MLQFIIIIGIVFVLQGIFNFIQMKHLTNAFMELRRKGKVACGRKSGGFRAGAVAMFRIDDEGIVQEAIKLEGTSAFARVKSLEGFEGRYIGSLTAEDVPKSHINLGKAIEDAAFTYRRYTAGEDIEEAPVPGLLQQAGMAVGSIAGNINQKRFKRNKAT